MILMVNTGLACINGIYSHSNNLHNVKRNAEEKMKWEQIEHN